MSESQPSTFYIDLFTLNQHYMSVGVIGTADSQNPLIKTMSLIRPF